MTRRSARPVAVVTLATAATVAACSPQAPQEQASPTAAALPASPVTDALVACMEAAGWDATRSWTGGVDYGQVPADQQSAWQTTADACAQESGFASAWDRATLGEDGLRELYEQEVVQHDCLIALGLPSPPPPSFESYQETYQTDQWYFASTEALSSLSESRTQEVVGQCPPPTYFMDIEAVNARVSP